MQGVWFLIPYILQTATKQPWLPAVQSLPETPKKSLPKN